MKIRIISTLALLAGLLMSGCSREEIPEGVPTTGNRVVFTLAGRTSDKNNTRAFGDNDQAQPMTATDAEKKVTSLIAVAYEKQESGEMGFYRAFDVQMDGGNCSFDIAKDGRFDVYLVANAATEPAGDCLANSIKTLGVGTPVSTLEELIVVQAPDEPNAFVMTTPEALKVISYSGEVADCGEVSLRRLSVRIDIRNQAEGLTINSITFHNRAVKSQLFTPNTMLSDAGTVTDTDYPDVNLVGSFSQPSSYESKIYSYENLSQRGDATIPTLDINYTYNQQTYTHTVEFLDASDPSGDTPLALKRNYLYRITVGLQVEPEFNVEVLDWSDGATLSVDKIPFQAQMNAALAVTNFAKTNVATLNEGENGGAGSITFVTDDPNNTSAYFPWSEKWATTYYYESGSNTYYRVPTKDEAYLLFPDVANSIQFDAQLTGDTEIDETLPDYLFGSTEKNGGAGKSIFRNASTVSSTSLQNTRAGIADPIIYAIRFKGTAQYAAYRYENKNSGDASNGELEIRIKALQAGSLLTIDDVANEAYWGNPADLNTDSENQLIWHIAATGYKVSSDQDVVSRGINSFMWASDSVDETNACDFGHSSKIIDVTSFPKEGEGALLLVKTTAEAHQTLLNSRLMVNMFTPNNVLTLDPVAKKVTFYEKPEVARELCPTTSYFRYQWLSGEDDGTNSPQGANSTDLRNATFTDDAGNEYRLPTAGELNLLLPTWAIGEDSQTLYYPWWNDNQQTNALPYVAATTPFEETVYLENDGSYKLNTDGKQISGTTQLKVGSLKSEEVFYQDLMFDSPLPFNIYPVYGIRFKGSSEYAAYRWETCQLESNSLERYFLIKIKALPEDSNISIDAVADEAFWKDGYLEFKIPSSGYYVAKPAELPDADNCIARGVFGFFLSSSLDNDTNMYCVCTFLNDADVEFGPLTNFCPLRLVKVE